MKMKLIFFAICLTFNMNAAISISSIQKTDSRCLNNGSIKVIASSNMQIIYSLDSGPATVAPQVSNTFNGLAAGRYKVLVQNLANERDSIYVIINSTYKFPDFRPLLTPPNCSGQNNGSIRGNPNFTTGRMPFSWQLRNNNTGQTTSQSWELFNNLSAGDYTLTLTDSCLNTTVKNFELRPNSPLLTKINGSIRKSNCQDVFADISINISPAHLPLTIRYKYQGNIETTVFQNMPSSTIISKKLNYDPVNSYLTVTVISKCGDSISTYLIRNRHNTAQPCYSVKSCDSVQIQLDNDPFPSKVIYMTKNGQHIKEFTSNVERNYVLPNLTAGDNINIVSIVCNDTFYNNLVIQPFANIHTIVERTSFSNCMKSYFYSLVNHSCHKYLNTKYYLIDDSSGKILDSNNYNSLVLTNYPKGKNYRIQIKNNCTQVLANYTFFWKKDTNPTANAKLTSYIIKEYDKVCLDSTVTLKINVSGNIGSELRVISIKGPPNRRNLKEKYGFVLWNNYAVENGYSSITIYNLTIGKYTVYFGNSECQKDSINFEVFPIDVSNNYFKFTPIKACGDNNKIEIKLTSIHNTSIISQQKTVQGSYSVFNLDSGTYVPNYHFKNFNYGFSNNFEFKETVNYLKTGRYVIAIQYKVAISGVIPTVDNLVCNEILDTIFIPPYTRPSIKVVVKVRCNENTYVVFIPDSADGVFPYKFEINQGPVTYSEQYANYFNINQIGNYKARIWDICGNANTMDFSVDTLKFNPIYESDKSCASRNVKIAYQSSPFFKYKWTTPSGSIIFKDSLVLDTVKNEDIGRYEVTRYVNFYGCKDSFKNTYSINKHKFYHQIDTIYEGDSVYFAKVQHKKTGIYHDTIFLNPCDSFSKLNLVVIDTNHIDSILYNYQRCVGDTVFYLDTFFAKTGTYIFHHKSNWGKRSTTIFDLSFDFFIRGKEIKYICQGEYYKGKNLAGIYFDTLSSGQVCDSIAELEIIVNPIFQNVHHKLVCDGDSIRFEGKYYNVTGEYIEKYKSKQGCDSIEILKLKVLDKPYMRYDTFKACKRYDYKRKPYFENTNLLDTFFNILGCDSVYLFIHLNIGSTPLQFYDSIYFCDTVRVGGRLYYNNFYYRDTIRYTSGLKCDSMYRLFKYNHRKSSQLKLDLFPNTTILHQGEKVRMTLTTANHYRWSTGDTVHMLEFIAERDTWFTAIAWNSPLCKDTISLRFEVLEPGLLDIPNAFAPDGMMENRIFKPNFKGMIEITRFEIYNRWGEKIYSTNTKDNIGWDGTYKGEPMPTGVFTYLLEYKVNRNIFFKSGEVLLVR